MAAVLACGPDAWLSHRSCRSAARFDPQRWETDRRHDSGPLAQATSGVYVHRSTTLAPEDFSVVNAIPGTSVSRTRFDLAEVLPRRQLERAFDQAEQMQVFDLTAINDQLERNPTRPAVAKVKSLLAEHYVGSTPTDSMFEDLLIPLLRAAGLPTPEVQAHIILDDGEPPMRRDFVWREQRPKRRDRRSQVALDGAGVGTRPPQRLSPRGGAVARAPHYVEGARARSRAGDRNDRTRSERSRGYSAAKGARPPPPRRAPPRAAPATRAAAGARAPRRAPTPRAGGSTSSAP